MEVNGRQLIKKSMLAILLIVSVMLIAGRISAPLTQSFDHTVYAKEDSSGDSNKKEDSNKKKDDSKKEDSDSETTSSSEESESSSSDSEGETENGEDLSDEDAAESFASKVFDDSDKNASKFYYNSQIKSKSVKVDTVESIIERDTDLEGQGERYAAFLQTLHNWNLYKTYTTQVSLMLSFLMVVLKSIVGIIIMICLVIGLLISTIMGWVADLAEWLNIFKYIDHGVGDDNPLKDIINPIVQIIHDFNYLGMIAVTFIIGLILVMFVLGFGRAANRGAFLMKSGSKALVSLLSITCVAFLLAGFLSSYAEMVKKGADDDGVTSGINDLPRQYIVNTEGYIGGSLDKAIDNSLKVANDGGSKDEVKNALTNNRFVLERLDTMPETEKQVRNRFPDSDFVISINKIADSDKASTENTASLVLKWVTNSTLTPNDIDTQHNVSKQDKEQKDEDGKKGFLGSLKNTWIKVENFANDVENWMNDHLMGGSADEKRMYQFKLSPQAEYVKVFDGKKAFSGDLNEVSIQAASVAGNGGFGVFARTAEMTAVMLALTTFTTILLYALISAVVKSISMLLANFAISTFGSVAGFIGIIITLAMLVVSTFTAFFLIDVAGASITGISRSMADTADNLFPNTSGTVKQVGASLVTSALTWIFVIFLLQARRAIVSTIEGFFKRILDAVGLQGGKNGTELGKAAHNSVSNMANSERDGVFAPHHVRDISKDAMGGFSDGFKSSRDKNSTLGGNSFSNFGKNVSDGFNNAKDAALGSISGKLDEAYSGNERDGTRSLGGLVAGNLSDRLNKSAKNVENKGEQAFDDQENVMNNLDDAKDNYDDATKDLAKKQNELDDLKRNDAPQDEIDAKQAEVEAAQANVDKAEQDLDKAAGEAVSSGVTSTNEADEREKMNDHISDAERNAKEAEQKLSDAENELQEMQDMNASPEEIAEQQAKVEQLRSEAESARGYANDIKNAGEGDVYDADAIQEAVNEKRNSDTGVRDAERELEQTEATGGLTQEQSDRAHNSAKMMDESLKASEQDAQAEVDKQQEKLDGMNHISNNGGKAFSDDTIEQQGESIKDLHEQLSNSEAKANDLSKSGFSQADIAHQENKANAENARLENLKASNAPDEEIEQQEAIATTETKKLADMKNGSGIKQAVEQQNAKSEQIRGDIKAQNQIRDAISTGNVNQGTISAGETVYNNAKAHRQEMEQNLDNIEARHAAGQQVSRTELANAQREVEQATARENQAHDVLVGLRAQHATGGVVSDEGIRQQEIQTDRAYQNRDKIRQTRQELSEVMNGQGLSQQGAQSMAAANEIIQQKATQTVREKQQAYENSAKSVARAEEQVKQGRMSATELGRIKNRHKVRSEELNVAQQQAQSVTNEGRGIKQMQQHINNNIDNARANINKAKDTQTTYTDRMSSVAKRGGLGKRSTAQNNMRHNLEEERKKYRARPNTYANNLRASAAREQRHEERNVIKGYDPRRKSPLMHDAINNNRRQNDPNHPDYNPTETLRDKVREEKRQARLARYDNNNDNSNNN